MTAEQHADVLVIGGGIVGLSVAWQLRELGWIGSSCWRPRRSDRDRRGARAAALTVTADVVVNAAGAWAARVAAMAGASVPVTPSPRVKLMTDHHPALPADMPMIVDLPTGAYVRGELGHAIVGVKP